MSLTPDDIENQVFKERFRGYDQDEVDAFLDRASARITELTRERDGLRERLADAERQAAETGESGQLLQRTLLAAQRSADETIDEARATAEQTLEDARHRAEEIIDEAHEQVHEDQRRAREVLEHVRSVVADMARFRAEYRERVEAMLGEQLALLDRAGDLPELPEGLRSMADLDAAGTGGVEQDAGGQVYWESGPEI